MAKRSGQKSSRSERKAGKKRAQRAREHGLPERREPAVSSRSQRVRAATPEPGSQRDSSDRSSDAPRAPEHKQLIPTPIKVLGIAVVILIGGYVLSQKRDQALTETKPAPEAPSALASGSTPSSESARVEATANAAAPEVVTAPPVVEPALAAPAHEAPAVVEPSKPAVVEPSKPIAAVPSVAAPSKPKVVRPVAPVVAAPAPPAPAAAPVAPAAPPAAAAPAPAAPAKPADNPY